MNFSMQGFKTVKKIIYTELRSQPPTLELNFYATLREIAEEVSASKGSVSSGFLNFPDSNIVGASVSSYGECSYRHMSSKCSVCLSVLSVLFGSQPSAVIARVLNKNAV